MIVYIDKDLKCHTSPGEGLRELKTDAFEGKCKQYIEGYRFVPEGETWIREDGQAFAGEMVAPWRDDELLTEFQALYEEERARQTDMREALDAIYTGVTE